MPSPPIWRPAREWAGRTVCVVATGPSLDLPQVRCIGLARLRDRCRVIAVNDAVLVAWFADICFGADGKWWEARSGLPSFPGRRVGLAEGAPRQSYDLSFLGRLGVSGYSADPGFVYTQSNSGAMAVQAAAQLSEASIALCGFDMKPGPNAERHFFGPYEEKTLQSKWDMAKWADDFRAIAAALAGRLISCTPGSALNDFVPYRPLGEVLA